MVLLNSVAAQLDGVHTVFNRALYTLIEARSIYWHLLGSLSVVGVSCGFKLAVM